MKKNSIKKEKKVRARKIAYNHINLKARKKVDALLLHNKDALNIFNAIDDGKTSYLKEVRKETTSFDETWITLIEETLPHLEKVIEHPRITTKSVNEVLPIELSKKVTSESVQHLASHSQFIKTVKPNGDVVPERIMNVLTDDNFVTYENRMIATLVRHLILFLYKRYDYLMKNAGLFDYETLYVHNESVVNGNKVEVETKVKYSHVATDQNSQSVQTYIDRIKHMYDLVSTFKRTELMEMLKKTADIRLPLLKTNIIRKNPDYRSCANLLVFIERYDKIGITFLVEQRFDSFKADTQKYLKELVLLNFLSLDAEPNSEVLKEAKHLYKPHFITTPDDDLFDFNDFSTSPIYIRADKEYFEKKLEKVEKIAKPKPTREELEAKKAAYAEKRRIENEKRKADELLKRKALLEKEKLKEEARQEKVRKEKEAAAIAKRKEEEAKRADLELKKARERIITVAKEEKNEKK